MSSGNGLCRTLAVLAVLLASVARGQIAPAGVNLSFGPGNKAAGMTDVPADMLFDPGTGCGFEPGSTVRTVGAAGADRPGCVTADSPFFFSVRVPEGNWKVTVTLGNPGAPTTTTVRAELRRLMLDRVVTKPGERVVRSFIVNTRSPKISTGGEVKLKGTRESVTEARAWDDRLTLEFDGEHPSICRLRVEPVDVPTVYILGDSTVCDQPAEPYASWGQMLPVFFKPEVAIANHAESGETIRSSTAAHRFDKVMSLIKPGDYLLIQFGHNDMKSKDPDAPAVFKADLAKWVAQVKAKGATAVLVTPMNRHSFKAGVVINSLSVYPDLVRQVAAESHVPLIDLNAMSKTLYESLGEKDSIQLFEHNAELTKFDPTHHSPYGAYELAKCVVEGIRQNKLPVARSVVGDLGAFDPAKPDRAADFHIPPGATTTTERPPGDTP